MKKLTKFLLFILSIILLTIPISLFRFSMTSGNGGVGSLGLIAIIPLESFGMSVVLTLLAFLIVPKLPRINIRYHVKKNLKQPDNREDHYQNIKRYYTEYNKELSVAKEKEFK